MISALLFLALAAGFAVFPVVGLLVNVGVHLGVGGWITEPLLNRTLWLLNGVEISLMIPAAVLLLRRASRGRSMARERTIVAMISFGVVSLVFLEGATLKSTLGPAIGMSFRWGLLFFAYLRLSDSERRWLRIGIMSLSVIAGSLTVVAVATGSPLAVRAVTPKEEGTFGESGTERVRDIEQRLRGRYAAPGFYTLMPLGLWMLVGELVPRTSWRGRVPSLPAAAGVGIIVVAMIVNLSRNNLIGFLAGVVVAAWYLSASRSASRMAVHVAARGVVILAFGFMLLRGLMADVTTIWMDRLTGAERLLTAGGRLEKNISMLAVLVSDIAPFGVGVPATETPGDPHLLPLAWWSYGLFFTCCLVALAVGAWVDLIRIRRFARDAPGWGMLLAAGPLCGYLIHWQFLVASGGYMTDAFWLAFWISLAEIQRLSAACTSKTGRKVHGAEKLALPLQDFRIPAGPSLANSSDSWIRGRKSKAWIGG
jgi:hypothetical protein